MGKIKNLSVRKTILLYLAVGLICSFLLSAVIVRIATYTQEQIWWNYVDQEKYFEAVNGEEGGGGSPIIEQRFPDHPLQI